MRKPQLCVANEGGFHCVPGSRQNTAGFKHHGEVQSIFSSEKKQEI